MKQSDDNNEQAIGDSLASAETSAERKNRARRKILRSLVVGGGAVSAASVTPKEWSRPVVEAVVLPSHAATSAAGGINPFGVFTSGNVTIQTLQQTDMQVVDGNHPDSAMPDLAADESISAELLEFFMPSAQAALPLCNVTCAVEITAEIQNVSAAICVTGDAFEYLTASVNPGSPPMLYPAYGSYLAIEGGEFRRGKWHLDVLSYSTNASTVVTLSPGGVLSCNGFGDPE